MTTFRGQGSHVYNSLFLDPPYRAYEKLYGGAKAVADEVEAWARENANLRVALCGHKDDYDLPGWDAVEWSRGRLTYSGKKTTDKECVWYSPTCIKPEVVRDLFSESWDEMWTRPFDRPELISQKR